MKRIYKTALAAITGLASVATVNASSFGDVLVGFTQAGANGSGNDLLYDLGAPSSFTDGQTWNLNSLLAAQSFNLTAVQWGVFGDANTSVDGANPQKTWVTTGGVSPDASVGLRFSAYEPAIDALDTGNWPNGAYPGNSLAVSSSPSDASSWNGQTTIGGSFTSLADNLGFVPNVTGLTSNPFWQVLDNGSKSQLGSFTLSANGVLTFHLVSNTPPPPKIVNITRSGNTSTIFFTTASGTFTYTLYYTNSAGLTAPVATWPASPTTVTGNGQTNSLQNITTDPNRFYRVGAH